VTERSAGRRLRILAPAVLVAILATRGSANTPPVTSTPSSKPTNRSTEGSVAVEADTYYRRGLAAAGGNGVPQDYAAAARDYLKAAEKGHMAAQYNLAWLYENGLGVKRDYKQAAAWYRKAADQGDPESQNNLGLLYASGQGVPRSDTEAVRWYLLAAAQGDVEGTNNLGTMYLQGRGVERNPARAFELCRKAAESGYAAAENNLGLMYATGQGVGKDYVWAYAWLDLAAGNNPASAVLRDRIAATMTPIQIESARKRAAGMRVQEKRKGK